jgi:hypothetical protein|nr:MAG TPA: hypothetical protein [Caudoviricetes sp.]
MIRPSMNIINQSNAPGSVISVPILSEDELRSIELMLETPELFHSHEWSATVSRLLEVIHTSEGFIVNQQATIARLHRLLRKWFVAVHTSS